MRTNLRGFDARHPLRRKAVLVALIAEFAIVAAALGVPAEYIGVFELVAATVINIGVLAGVVVAAEPETTPEADPRNNAGERLVAESRIAQERALWNTSGCTETDEPLEES